MGSGRCVPLRCSRMVVLHNSVQAQRHAEEYANAILARMFRRASHHACISDSTISFNQIIFLDAQSSSGYAEITIYRGKDIGECLWKEADFTGIHQKGVWRKWSHMGSISTNCQRNNLEVAAIIAHTMIAATSRIEYL